MATGSLVAAAVLISNTFPQHDRTAAHYGFEWDDDVILSAAIGPYPAATPLNVFLAGLYGSIQAFTGTYATVASFTAGAYLSGGVVRANAVVRRVQTGSLYIGNNNGTGGAYIVRGGVASFTGSAWIQAATKAFSADAMLVDNVC